MGQRPPDLDAQGQPASGRPPDLDASGKAVAGDQYQGPDSYWGGFLNSASKTIEDTKAGTYRGAAMAVPNLISAAMHPVRTATNAAHAIAHPIDSAHALAAAASDPEQGGAMIGNIVTGAALPAAVGAARQFPGGRILTSGWAGTKAGAAKLPIVGAPVKAFARGARKSWAESAPGVEAPPSGPTPPMAGRPDLVAAGEEGAYNATQSAPAGASSPTEQAYQRILENRGRFDPQATKVPPQVPKLVPEGAGPAASGKLRLTGPHAAAQYLRDEFGSEQAGRMLYGKSGVGIPPAERTAAIKRLAPGESRLPNQARRAITQGVQQGSPADAWNYVQDAPNDVAREYMINMMRGRQ